MSDAVALWLPLTPPLLVWVTVVVEELEAVAAPVVIDAVLEPVFDEAAVLLAVPPVLPVVRS
jgi:hypothetical protein